MFNMITIIKYGEQNIRIIKSRLDHEVYQMFLAFIPEWLHETFIQRSAAFILGGQVKFCPTKKIDLNTHPY